MASLGQRSIRFGAALAAALVVVSASPAHGQADPRRAPAPGARSGAIHFTREDTGTVQATDPFAPPGATPIIGDFVGGTTTPEGSLDDIFWYTPGAGGDALWLTRGDRVFLNQPQSVSGTYTPLVGYFGNDRDKEDILWYAPGSGADSLWDFNANGTITKTNLTINGTYTPIVGEFSPDLGTDVIWYAPGSAGDSWWDFNGDGTRTTRSISVSGRYRPVVGSFAGDDGADDILWYAPGIAADSLWDFNANGTRTTTPIRIDGSYTTVPGDFSGDGYGDLILYRPGTASDVLWNFTGPNGQLVSSPLTIDPTYTPVAGELFEQPQHRTDVLWFGRGGIPDVVWDFVDSTTPSVRAATLTGGRTPVLGTFDLGPGRGLDIIDLSS